MLTATRFADLRSWASASLPLCERLVGVYHDAARLEMVWNALLYDVANEDQATAVLQPAVSRVCRRLNGVVGESFTDASGFRAADALGVLRSIVGLRHSLSLAAPNIPQVVFADDDRWWLEQDGAEFKYLNRTDEIQRNQMRFPSRLVLAVGDWRFDVADDGSLVKATKK